MSEHLTPLQKELFSFAKAADHLNSELRNLPLPEQINADDLANFRITADLRDYLSMISRKAEYVAAVCVVKTEAEKEA